MSSLRLVLAQLNATVGDVPGNARRIEQAIRQAQSWLADVVVVPELSVCGYPPEDLLLKPRFVDDNLKALHSLARVARGIVALVGYVDRDAAGRLYNAVAVLAYGRRLATYRKQCLPNYGVFDEQRYFTSGTYPLLITVRGVHIGICVCEDLWEAEPIQRLVANGAQLVINLSASPYHAGKHAEREALVASRARANRVAVALCNLVGGQDELVFDGSSLIFDARGQRLAHGTQFREDVVIVDVSRAHLGPTRRTVRSAVSIARSTRSRPRLPVRVQRALGPMEEVYEALVLGVRDYVRKNRFDTVVLGLSGGVDSALTASIAVDALGADHVVGVMMPSRFSSTATQRDAARLATRLGIRSMRLSIEPVFRTYLTSLRRLMKWRRTGVGLTEQNIQARIRGNFLMALSNKFGWLVLTTGNKSEIATGYTTLYGDMAGGFAVLKDVPKTLVYQLARFRNSRGASQPIPARVLQRAPSAELAPNQRDQQALPPYSVLDRILKAYVEEDHSLTDLLGRNQLGSTTTKRVIQMVDRAEYKRRQGPPGIKITPKAFGRDRRMPITNRYEHSE